MSCLKRTLDGQDPDYEDNVPHEAKRLRLLEKNAKAEFSQRVSAIIQKEFSVELVNRERDVHEIQERLHEAQKTLHMLRYGIVSAFYNKKQVQVCTEDKQKRIHPAVKKLIGKEPRSWEPLHQRPSKYRQMDKEPPCKEEEQREPVSKVPRYIPPKTVTSNNPPTSPCRGTHHKVKKRLVIGNISKWVPVDTREDAASHKWMMYVRGPKEAADVSGFVSKVRFFLHPSYRPHDVAEVSSWPFHLSRRGWGEFPVRVQIHFHNPRNRPVDLIHHLKLDRSYTGLQTLGAETIVDIWLQMGVHPSDTEDTASSNDNSESAAQPEDQSVPAVKVEVEEPENPSASAEVPSVCAAPPPPHEIVPFDHDYTIVKKKVEESVDQVQTSQNHVQIPHRPQMRVQTPEIPVQTSQNNMQAALQTLQNHVQTSQNHVQIPQALQNHTQTLKNHVHTSQVHVQTLQNHMETPQVHVQTSQNEVQILQNNAQTLQNHVQAQQIQVQVAQNHVQTLQNNVQTLPNNMQTLQNNAQALQNNVQMPQKLTTLVKCMDRSGRVFYLTLGKKQLQDASQSLLLPQNSKPPVTVLKLDAARKAQEQQSVLIVKNGQMYLLKHSQPGSQSVLVKGGTSLLKKQPTENADSRLLLSGRTLVLNKGSSQQAMHLSKTRHEEALNAALEHCKFSDVAMAVRWLLRHMPLTSTSVQEPEFRVLHPYAASDVDTYLQWNVGKQKAAEWLRARAVHQVLRGHFPAERVWSIHAIAVWAKMHGYTPLPAPPSVKLEESGGDVPSRSSYSEPVGVMDWLVTNHKSDDHDESDGEVDVVSIQSPKTLVAAPQQQEILQRPCGSQEVLPMDPCLEAQCTFVRETARDLGFRLVPQELVPGVLFCATERVLLEAVRSLADDLLRRALCIAWKRNSNRYSGSVSVEDVHAAILSRPELDLLSNRGLGLQVADTS